MAHLSGKQWLSTWTARNPEPYLFRVKAKSALQVFFTAKSICNILHLTTKMPTTYQVLSEYADLLSKGSVPSLAELAEIAESIESAN